MNRLVQLSLGALWGLQAFGISRVGTAKIGDDTIGFEATIPRDLSFARKIEGGVQLLGLVRSAPFGAGRAAWSPPIERSVVQVLDFATDFAEFSKTQRAELTEILSARGFRREESANSCVERFTKTNGSVETKFALWGPGRGLALAVWPAVQSSNESVGRLLESIVLTEGACQW